MRKGVVILLVAGVVFAESPPSFREYVLKTFNRSQVGLEYVLISVDERRSVTVVNAYYELLHRNGYCLKYGFPAFTKIKAGGMETEEPYPENIGIIGLSLRKDAVFYDDGYCKDKAGNVIIRYSGSAIEHPPEKMMDIFSKRVEEIFSKIDSFDALVREFKAKPVSKSADLFVTNEGDYSDRKFTPFIALGVCRKHGGELFRVAEGKEERFVDYAWRVAYKPGYRDPVETYSGVYVCRGGNLEFTFNYRPYSRNNYISHTSYIRAGIDQQLVAKVLSSPQKEQQTQPQMDVNTLIAKQVAMTRSPVVLQQGSMKYKGRYNGEQGGCSLVSVLVFIGTY